MIDSLKDLEKFLKLCRKQGITKASCGTLSFEFGELPKGTQIVQEDTIENPYSNFPQGELTPEQLAFYSSGGTPEEDPFRKDN